MGCNHAKAPGVEDRTIPGDGGSGMKDDKKMPSYRWLIDVDWSFYLRCSVGFSASW